MAKPCKREITVKQPKPDPENAAKVLCGSDYEIFNLDLLNRVVRTAWCPQYGEPEGEDETTRVGLAVGLSLKAFQPVDEIEGMLASQAVALHHASLECLRRAMLPNQSPEVASRLRKDGANAARAFTDMLAALDRKRGKGQQHIRVERVVVHDGGQAIVGPVQAGAIARPTQLPMAAIEQDEQPLPVMVEAGG